MRRAEEIRVGRIRLLDAHLVGKPGLPHVLGHLRAAAELVDERLVEPRLVDPQIGIREQPVAIEPLDVVALERAAIAPDVHVVFFHGDDEHRAGDGAAERRGVEVGHAGRRDVECAALQRREALGDELSPAVDQTRLFSAVVERLPRNRIVVRLVRLPEIRRVSERNRALPPHPVQRGAGVEPTRKCNPDPFTNRQLFENSSSSHRAVNYDRLARLRPARGFARFARSCDSRLRRS